MKILFSEMGKDNFRNNGYNNWTINFLTIFALSSLCLVNGRDLYLKQYRPVNYGQRRENYRLIQKLDHASIVSHPAATVNTVDSLKFAPGRRLIYRVARPMRVRKVLTEVDGKLVYEVPQERPRIPSTHFRYSTNHHTSRDHETNKNFDSDFDVPVNLYRPIYRHATTYGSTQRPPRTIPTKPARNHHRTLPTARTKPNSMSSYHDRLRNSDIHHSNKTPRQPSFDDTDRPILSNIVPPPGLQVVMVNRDTPLVDLRSPTRQRSGKNDGAASINDHNSNFPNQNRIYPSNVSTRKVLRIQAANMDEARAIVANVGPGFKVRMVNKTTTMPLSITTTTTPLRNSTSRISTQQFPTTPKTSTAPLTTSIESPNIWWKG